MRELAFGSRHDVFRQSPPREVTALEIADVDNDGDQDVIVASSQLRAIRWHENTDGRGTFGALPIVIDAAAVDVRALALSDLDDDGDFDVVAGSGEAGEVVWYENLDRARQFAAPRKIASTDKGVKRVFIRDVDRDGDGDVVTLTESKVIWSRNESGNQWHEPILIADRDSEFIILADVADIDGDAHLDVVIHNFFRDKFEWIENADGLGTDWKPRPVDRRASHPASLVKLSTGDIDDDGDIDIVTRELPFDGNFTLYVYENSDGLGTFSRQRAVIWAEIRRLHEIERLSKRAIAQRLRCCHTTVTKALAMEEPPSQIAKPSCTSKLDPYKNLALDESFASNP